MTGWAEASAQKQLQRLIKKAKDGDISSLHSLQSHFRETGDSDSYESWCRWGANQGDVLSIWRVAESLSYSRGLDDPSRESVQFLKYHAEKGGKWAMALYAHQVFNMDGDYEESVKYHRLAAEQGVLMSQRLLAWNLDHAGHTFLLECDDTGDFAVERLSSVVTGKFQPCAPPPWSSNDTEWQLERAHHHWEQIKQKREELEKKVDAAFESAEEAMGRLVGQSHLYSFGNSIYQDISEFNDRLRSWIESKEGERPKRPNFHFVLTGAPGTGKNEFVRSLGKYFFAWGFTSDPEIIEVSRNDLVAGYVGQTALKTKAVLESAKHRILFIDEAYTLKKSSGNDFGQEAIDTILKHMEDHRGDFTLVVGGYQREMKAFLRSNNGLASRFNQTVHLNSLDLEGLDIVFARLCGLYDVRYYHEEVTPGIQSFFKNSVGNENFGNAREVRKLFENAHRRFKQRIREDNPLNETRPDAICFDDVFGHLRERIDAPEGRADLERLLSQLNQMIGLSNVKHEIQQFVDSELARFDDGDSWLERGDSAHMLLLGPPGTGKTEVARIIGKILHLIGMVPEDSFTELSRNDLVGSGPDGTERTLATLDNCLGGVVFIDEIYTLVDQSDKYSSGTSETLETVMKYMEDHRGEIAIIGAGYADKLSKILEVNPGLSSRFGLRLNFESYNADELAEIFERMAKSKNLTLDTGVVESVERHFAAIKRDETFGNAREVRNLLEAAERSARSREAQLPEDPPGTTIQIDDLPVSAAAAIGEFSQAEIDSVMAELDELVGVDGVADQFNQLVAFAKIADKRRSAGLPYEPPSMHLTFVGPPGTGKTTVARLLGRLFKGLGLLATGHVIEASRSDLVAGYVGQTAMKTQALVERALGGVLFIDEAYSLVEQSEGSNFSAEAISALLIEMENHRDELSVVFAGYTDEMEQFVAMNPGLRSRIGTSVEFSALSPDALSAIADQQFTKRGYHLRPEARNAFEQLITQSAADPDFGNARGVRRTVDAVILAQAVRLANETETTPDQLSEILDSDILASV